MPTQTHTYTHTLSGFGVARASSLSVACAFLAALFAHRDFRLRL